MNAHTRNRPLAGDRVRRQLRDVNRVLRGLPRSAWVCALVATLGAACWSVITPPFQAPDEPAHFAYTQYLAETGRLPDSEGERESPEQAAVLSDLHRAQVTWHPEHGTISSPAAVQKLRHDLAQPLSRVGAGAAGVATSEPPLYYAIEVIPYKLGSGADILVRLELMRLLSALLAGITALFSYLFVREALPGVSWAWIVGGLGVALYPVFEFTSGFATPDALLLAICASLFFCLARAFRRGLTWQTATALGVLTAMGFMTKLSFLGLAPGVALGLVILAFRGIPASADAPGARRAFGPMALAMAIVASPVGGYVLFNLLEGNSTLDIVSNSISETVGGASPLARLSYIWDFYLPHLPGMEDYFPGISTLRDVWFDRAIGLYGWLDTSFPAWVYTSALVPAGLAAILVLKALVASRTTLKRRLPELSVYAAIGIGLAMVIALSADVNPEVRHGLGWAQPRYLLPLLPLGAAMLTLIARGAGKRWGPAVGALLITLLLAQDVFSQLLTVARFYG